MPRRTPGRGSVLRAAARRVRRATPRWPARCPCRAHGRSCAPPSTQANQPIWKRTKLASMLAAIYPIAAAPSPIRTRGTATGISSPTHGGIRPGGPAGRGARVWRRLPCSRKVVSSRPPPRGAGGNDHRGSPRADSGARDIDDDAERDWGAGKDSAPTRRLRDGAVAVSRAGRAGRRPRPGQPGRDVRKRARRAEEPCRGA